MSLKNKIIKNQTGKNDKFKIKSMLNKKSKKNSTKENKFHCQKRETNRKKTRPKSTIPKKNQIFQEKYLKTNWACLKFTIPLLLNILYLVIYGKSLKPDGNTLLIAKVEKRGKEDPSVFFRLNPYYQIYAGMFSREGFAKTMEK